MNAPQVIATGTLGALNAASSWEYFSGGSAVVAISGTFVASVQVQITLDGTTAIPASADGSGSPVNLTAPGAVVVDIPTSGLGVRVQATAYTSGTVTYSMAWGPVAAPVRPVGG
jgi:hypothetical protein